MSQKVRTYRHEAIDNFLQFFVSRRQKPFSGVCRILAGFLFVCGLQVGCSGHQSETQEGGSPRTPGHTVPAVHPVQENRSRVLGRVLAVHREADRRYRLTVLVEQTDSLPGYPGFARPGDTLEVIPNFLSGPAGEVDWNHPTNRALLQGAEVKPGQQIRAVLYMQGGEQGTHWLLMELEQVLHGQGSGQNRYSPDG